VLLFQPSRTAWLLTRTLTHLLSARKRRRKSKTNTSLKWKNPRCCVINNNNNNTTNANVYSGIVSGIKARPLREFTRFIRWMQTKHQVAFNPHTKPTDLGCESTCRLPLSTPIVAIYYTTEPEDWYSFYRPTEGRRLSRPEWLIAHRNGLPARSHPSKY